MVWFIAPLCDSFKCRNFLVHAPLFQQLWLVRFDFNHLTAGFDFIWFVIFLLAHQVPP